MFSCPLRYWRYIISRKVLCASVALRKASKHFWRMDGYWTSDSTWWDQIILNERRRRRRRRNEMKWNEMMWWMYKVSQKFHLKILISLTNQHTSKILSIHTKILKFFTKSSPSVKNTHTKRVKKVSGGLVEVSLRTDWTNSLKNFWACFNDENAKLYLPLREGPLDWGLRGIVRLSRFEFLEKFEFLSGM